MLDEIEAETVSESVERPGEVEVAAGVEASLGETAIMMRRWIEKQQLRTHAMLGPACTLCSLVHHLRERGHASVIKVPYPERMPAAALAITKQSTLVRCS